MGYQLIEITGDEDFIRGYVAGWFTGRGVEAKGIFFGSDHGMEDEGFIEKLEQLLGLKVEKNLLIVADELLVDFNESIAKLPEPPRMKIGARRTLRGVRFPFTVTIYNRALAKEIDALLTGPNGNARIDGLERRSEDEFAGDGAAKPKVGAYAPDHGFSFQARGAITGDVGCALTLDRKLAAYENVKFSHPELDLAD